MIDAHAYMDFLDSKGLSSEGFWFLYRIMMQEQNNHDGIITLSPDSEEYNNFSRLSKKYDETAMIGKTKIDWVSVAISMEELGFCEIWTRKDDSIELKDIKITDKFRSEFVVSSVRKALDQLIEIYPKFVKINREARAYPSIDVSKDKLAKLYDEHVLKGGHMKNHYRCMEVTHMYLDDIGRDSAPYKLSNYFEAFEGIAIGYEGGERAFKGKDNGEDL